MIEKLARPSDGTKEIVITPQIAITRDSLQPDSGTLNFNVTESPRQPQGTESIHVLRPDLSEMSPIDVSPLSTTKAEGSQSPQCTQSERSAGSAGSVSIYSQSSDTTNPTSSLVAVKPSNLTETAYAEFEEPQTKATNSSPLNAPQNSHSLNEFAAPYLKLVRGGSPYGPI